MKSDSKKSQAAQTSPNIKTISAKDLKNIKGGTGCSRTNGIPPGCSAPPSDGKTLPTHG
jgi:bacteriocin-like protein